MVASLRPSSSVGNGRRRRRGGAVRIGPRRARTTTRGCRGAEGPSAARRGLRHRSAVPRGSNGAGAELLDEMASEPFMRSWPSPHRIGGAPGPGGVGRATAAAEVLIFDLSGTRDEEPGGGGTDGGHGGGGGGRQARAAPPRSTRRRARVRAARRASPPVPPGGARGRRWRFTPRWPRTASPHRKIRGITARCTRRCFAGAARAVDECRRCRRRRRASRTPWSRANT